jgi:hypothetical protein
MRKLIPASISVLLFIFVLQANATIRRVGYTATIQAVNNLDYVNFQAAHDAANNGDTIQLYPSAAGNVTYTGTISKALQIMGVGYLTNSYYLSGSEVANNNLQNLVGLINSCSFNIDLGSAGTVFQSLNNLNITTVNRVNDLNNITIKRCSGVSIVFDNSGVCDGWAIAQCYRLNIVQNNASGSFTGTRTINNLIISNCVIDGTITLSTSPLGTYTDNYIYNSIFITGYSLLLNNAYFTIQNSIFENQNFTDINNVSFVKNITPNDSISNPIKTNTGSSGNLFNKNIANIFVGYPTNPLVGGVNTYSPDARFKLKTGSVAINAGYLPGTTTVTDCGIYGNSTNAYKIAGMPPIPVFIKLKAPSAIYSGSPYTMTFSIISNN